MHTQHTGNGHGDHEPGRTRRTSVLPGSGMTFFLIVLALLLAIAFFYITKESRSDRRADAVTEAAETVDNATSSVARAAEKAAGKLRQDK